MKQFATLALLFILTACAGRSNDDVFIWDESVVNPFHGETLTIAVTHREPMWKFVNIFEQENPGVEIEWAVLGTDFDAVRERMAVQLMAGEAPLLMNSNFVDMRNRSFFVDWMPLIEAHPRFNDDEWFMDIFHALAEGGRLYELPAGVSYQTYAGNKNVPGLVEKLAQMDSISNQQLIEIFIEFGGADSGLHVGMVNFPFFSDEFVNFETGYVNFASPEFISLLEMALEFTKPLPDSVLEAMTQTWHVEHLMANYYMFNSAPSCYIMGSDIFVGDVAFANRIPFVNNDGELVIRPDFFQQLALNAAATETQRALALEFFRLTQDVTDNRTRSVYENVMAISWGQVPINRARFEHCLRRDIGSAMWNFIQPGLRLSIAHDEAVEYLLSQIRREMDRPMASGQNVPLSIVHFFNELRNDLNLGIISPHEAAAAMQNRVALEILEGN